MTVTEDSEILIGHRRGEIEHPQCVVIDELKRHYARVFEICVVLVCKILEAALDVVDVPKDPVHQVNEMAELREQGSAIQILGAFP